MKAMIEQAFKDQVLDPIKHAALVDELPRFAERAGIAPNFICQSALYTLQSKQLEYLRKVPILAQNGVLGAIMQGEEGNTVQYMASMTGALVRAFVDARMLTVAHVIEELKSGGVEGTVLLIPNFFTPEEVSKFDFTKVAALADVLTDRAARQCQTVVGISGGLEAMYKQYGPRITGIITNYVEV